MSEQRPIVFGVAGGTASGKTTIARNILRGVGAERIAYLPHDAYYRDNLHMSLEERAHQNYDHPRSLENKLLVKHIKSLLREEPVHVPVYDFTLHRRTDETVLVEPSPIILVDGILIFTRRKLRELMDVKIFVDTASDVRFIRRLKRDIEERGRSLESVVEQYLLTVRPMHMKFVEPSKQFADVIIPHGGENTVAMAMVVSRLRELLTHNSEI
ncbi:MAG: uridine kinase [Ardenticatenaceae bacterium]|nr:uridine kinase [Anaerolineales bacterium]MCB8920511.1 uridine kinase [Ardenticatenaceae bacterium]MCB8989454.1 uridine kinase [Ardenticatenaceae bacterium]MCB9005008.1 uridine kinase [Ardenticatenaceae bacterium]